MKEHEFVAGLSDLIDRYKALKTFSTLALIQKWESDCEKLIQAPPYVPPVKVLNVLHLVKNLDSETKIEGGIE